MMIILYSHQWWHYLESFIFCVFDQGEGSALMGRANRFEQIVQSMTTVMDIPLTVKIRTGIFEDKSIAHGLIPRLRNAGASLVTV